MKYLLSIVFSLYCFTLLPNVKGFPIVVKREELKDVRPKESKVNQKKAAAFFNRLRKRRK